MENRYWRELGRSINPMGFGCWQIAGEHEVNGKPNGWGVVSESEAIHSIQMALENGIQFFDTAAGYGNGRSEELLGRAISTSPSRDSSVVCTKIPMTDAEVQALRHEDSLVQKVENSLSRLKRDRIDVLLIHNPPDTVDWHQFDAGKLVDLQKQGKIGTYGISSRTLMGAIKAADARFGTCIEWVFNLLERRPIEELFPLLEAAEMNFIARSPLSRGLLSWSYIRNRPRFGPNDFRSTLPRDWIEWVVESVLNLDLSERELDNLSKLALRYCLNFSTMSVVIPGIRRRSQLADYLTIAQEDPIDVEWIARLHARTKTHYPAW